MVKVPIPPNNGINLSGVVNRMDLTTHQSYEPMIVPSHLTLRGPNEFIPEMEKKYSEPSYVYKHIYVPSPEETTHISKKKKKKTHKTDGSWMDYWNPFSCENDYEDYDYAY